MRRDDDDDMIFDKPVREASQAHVALALLLDVSTSMIRDNKMDSLNNAVNNLINEIKEDNRLKDIVDLGIFSFGEKGRNQIVQGFRAMRDCEDIQLEATDNSTYVADALSQAVEMLRNRVEIYNQGGGAYRPWLVLFTDGIFHDHSWTLKKVSDYIKKREQEKKLSVYCVGIGRFDKKQLDLLTNEHNHVYSLEEARLTEFLSWVGRSLAVISRKTVEEAIEMNPLVFSI